MNSFLISGGGKMRRIIVLVCLFVFLFGVASYSLMAASNTGTRKVLPWLKRKAPKTTLHSIKINLRPKVSFLPKKLTRRNIIAWRRKVRELWKKIKSSLGTIIGGKGGSNKGGSSTTSGGNSVTGWGNNNGSGGQSSGNSSNGSGSSGNSNSGISGSSNNGNGSSGSSNNGNGSSGSNNSGTSGGSINIADLKKKILGYLSKAGFPKSLYPYVEKAAIEEGKPVINLNLEDTSGNMILVSGPMSNESFSPSGSSTGMTVSAGVQSQYQNGSYMVKADELFTNEIPALDEISYSSIMNLSLDYLLTSKNKRRLFKIYVPKGLGSLALNFSSDTDVIAYYTFIADDTQEKYGFMYHLSDMVISAITQGQSISLPFKTFGVKSGQLLITPDKVNNQSGWLLVSIGVKKPSLAVKVSVSVNLQVTDQAKFKDSLNKLKLDKNGNPICPIRHFFELDFVKASAPGGDVITIPLSQYGLGKNIYIKAKIVYYDLLKEKGIEKSIGGSFSFEGK